MNAHTPDKNQTPTTKRNIDYTGNRVVQSSGTTDLRPTEHV